MSRIKRETLKFMRIKIRPAHLSGDGDIQTVSGYVNNYEEFKRWDVELSNLATFGQTLTSQQQIDFSYFDVSGNSIIRLSPSGFFMGNIDRASRGEASWALTESAYRTTSFLIDGVHEPFDRTKHDLRNLYPRVYIRQSDGAYYNIASGNNFERREVIEKFPPLVFRINPLNINIQKAKLFKKIRTRAGWVFQHWGPQIGGIVIQGTTGSLIPDPAIKLGLKLPLIGDVPLISTFQDERPTVENSPALKAFKELEKWYDEDQSEESVQLGYLTALEYRGRVYVGHLKDFKTMEKGTDPFQLFYHINFVVHYDADNLQAATTRAHNQIVRNDKTLATVVRLKGADGFG